MHRGQQRAGVQWAIVLSGLLLTAAYGFATATRGSPGSGGIISAAPSTQDLGTPAKVKLGAVAVTIGGLPYRAGSVIRATISNGLRRTIYTLDSKTACSIAILERWDGKSWQTITGCALGRPPLVVALGPGRVRTVAIDPRSAHLSGGLQPSSVAFGAGRFRVKFTYGYTQGTGDPEPYTSYSPIFQIFP